MEPEQNTTPSPTPEEPTGQEPTREDKPAYEPYKKSTRIKAWLGVAFMALPAAKSYYSEVPTL